MYVLAADGVCGEVCCGGGGEVCGDGGGGDGGYGVGYGVGVLGAVGGGAVMSWIGGSWIVGVGRWGMDKRNEVDVFHEYIIFLQLNQVGMSWVRLNEELIWEL